MLRDAGRSAPGRRERSTPESARGSRRCPPVGRGPRGRSEELSGRGPRGRSEELSGRGPRGRSASPSGRGPRRRSEELSGRGPRGRSTPGRDERPSSCPEREGRSSYRLSGRRCPSARADAADSPDRRDEPERLYPAPPPALSRAPEGRASREPERLEVPPPARPRSVPLAPDGRLGRAPPAELRPAPASLPPRALRPEEAELGRRSLGIGINPTGRQPGSSTATLTERAKIQRDENSAR